MAEEQKAISSHLDEYYHVFKNGTTARLNVSPWTRQTVADGYWQNNNNITLVPNRYHKYPTAYTSAR